MICAGGRSDKVVEMRAGAQNTKQQFCSNADSYVPQLLFRASLASLHTPDRPQVHNQSRIAGFSHSRRSIVPFQPREVRLGLSAAGPPIATATAAAAMGYHELVLDAGIRDWVFIPLTLFIILMKLLMQYAHNITNATPVTTTEMAEIREQAAVARSQRLRAAAGWLPESAFRMRREWFTEKTTGVFSQAPKSRAMHETMATDPSFMVDMMKKNLTGLLPQIVMGTAVSFFFSGFVMGKIPFSLSPRFRPMLQRGVDLGTLDVSYFTALSYYFSLLFAMRGPFSLVFREQTLDESEMMRRQMNPMAGGAGFDAAGMFKAEKAGYEAADHEWALHGAEEAALAVLRQLR